MLLLLFYLYLIFVIDLFVCDVLDLRFVQPRICRVMLNDIINELLGKDVQGSCRCLLLGAISALSYRD
jgi:hypothetical protein